MSRDDTLHRGEPILNLIQEIVRTTKEGINCALFQVERSHCVPVTWHTAQGISHIEAIVLRDNDQVLPLPYNQKTIASVSSIGVMVTVVNNLSNHTTVIDLANPESIPTLLQTLEQVGIDFILDMIRHSDEVQRPHRVRMWQEILEQYKRAPLENSGCN